MAATTEQEWEAIQEALVKGGLRETIDHILLTRQDTLTISEANRRMLAEAFRERSPRFTITAIDNYFTGHCDSELVVEGEEVDGTLYSILHIGKRYVVMVGDQVTTKSGITFGNLTSAWNYVQRLTAL